MSNETSGVVVNRGMINKKMKQQMICAKLEETKSPSTISKIETKPLYKSF